MCCPTNNKKHLISSVLICEDTGSADLWIISTDCTMCNATLQRLSTTLPMYPIQNLKSADGVVTLTYGDSSTATDAIGVLGQDTVGVAGISLQVCLISIIYLVMMRTKDIYIIRTNTSLL